MREGASMTTRPCLSSTSSGGSEGRFDNDGPRSITSFSLFPRYRWLA